MSNQLPPTPSLTPAPSTPVGGARVVTRKQKILLMSIGGGGLLAIAAMLVYVLFFSITKQEYREAATQTNGVIAAYNSLSRVSSKVALAASDASVSDETYSELQQEMTRAQNNYEQKVSTLSQAPALDDRDVQSAYTTFVAVHKSFMGSLTANTELMTTVRDATVACSVRTLNSLSANDLSKLVATYNKGIAPCESAMKVLASTDTDRAHEVSDTALHYLGTLRAHLQKMQSAYVAGDRSTFEGQYTAYLDAAGQFAVKTSTYDIIQAPTPTPEKELNTLATTIQSRQ